MIELGTKLQISVEGTTTKHEAKLVGLRKDHYLIIKMPEKVLYMGHKLVIRYIARGRIYAFKADVLANIFEPDLLIFAKFPTDIMDKNLRSHNRRPCCLPVYVDVGIHMQQAVVADISKKGAMVVIDKASTKIKKEKLVVGDTIKVSLQLPGDNTVHTIDAILRNVTSEDLVIKLGLEFMEMKKNTEEGITNFLQVISIMEKVENL